ncbi:hypothetical protein ACR2XS_26290 [Klebsiella pneumoniae]
MMRQQQNACVVAQAKQMMDLSAKYNFEVNVVDKDGNVWVPAKKLHYKGNWELVDCGDHAELHESQWFKVFGETTLDKPAAEVYEDKYTGYFIVGRKDDESIVGDVKLELSPPDQANEYNFSELNPGEQVAFLLGECSSGHVKYSLTDDDTGILMKNGLLVYGVKFTPKKKT